MTTPELVVISVATLASCLAAWLETRDAKRMVPIMERLARLEARVDVLAARGDSSS